MRCVLDEGLFLNNQTTLAKKEQKKKEQKQLRLALKYVKNCQSGVSLVPFSAQLVSLQSLTAYERQYLQDNLFLLLCVRTRCLSICAPSFVTVVLCK